MKTDMLKVEGNQLLQIVPNNGTDIGNETLNGILLSKHRNQLPPTKNQTNAM